MLVYTKSNSIIIINLDLVVTQKYIILHSKNNSIQKRISITVIMQLKLKYTYFVSPFCDMLILPRFHWAAKVVAPQYWSGHYDSLSCLSSGSTWCWYFPLTLGFSYSNFNTFGSKLLKLCSSLICSPMLHPNVIYVVTFMFWIPFLCFFCYL